MQAVREVKERKARVTTPEQMMVRATRSKLGVSQAELATCINTPIATLRDWEQGRFSPPGVALCLFKLLASHPELLQELAVT